MMPHCFKSSKPNTSIKHATRDETGQHLTAPKSPVKNACISIFRVENLDLWHQ